MLFALTNFDLRLTQSSALGPITAKGIDLPQIDRRSESEDFVTRLHAVKPHQGSGSLER
jgi:hypothetical protein